MSLHFTLAMAAYARGTHHKLAFHALPRLQTSEHDKWQSFFLIHGEHYAIASKRPDDEFKDFKNHVLHPRDNYWGGAVDAARTWYAKLVASLKARAWDDVVEAAGILSHYLADPLHPFHTGQTDAENAIHRACEWSISVSFNSLFSEGLIAHATYSRRLPRDANWLARVQCESADVSNAHYERLIAHYDFARGVSDPPSGLDLIARKICSELLVVATATIAAVLDHAIDEAGVAPPDVSTVWPTLLAGIKIPQAQLLKRIENTTERQQVQAIYDELFQTGSVVAALPAENRAIRHAYQAEIVAAKPTLVAPMIHVSATPLAYSLPEPKPLIQNLKRSASVTPPAIQRGSPRITLKSDVVDAPSIGPKTAQRLAQHDVHTIGDLLNADASTLAAAMGQHHITTTIIHDWQDQARLVIAVPQLTGGAAQLFVGAGYRSPETLAKTEVGKLCADVLAFAATEEGHRILRDGTAPDEKKIAAWHANAAAL